MNMGNIEGVFMLDVTVITRFDSATKLSPMLECRIFKSA